MTLDQAALLAQLQHSVAAPQTLTARLGIEFLSAGADEVTARMPVAGNTQVIGLLHGGASAALAETVGSVAATLHAGPGKVALGVELNATHHRSTRGGYVTAVATPLHRGSRLATYEITVSDEDGRRLCTSRLTCMLVNRED